jgi:Ice-binding-like
MNTGIGQCRLLRTAGLTIMLVVGTLLTGQTALAAGPTAVELGSTTLVAGPTAVGLGTAASFAVLAGTPAVTSTGPTTVTGDLGVDPFPTVAGFPSGTVSGTIHRADAVAQQAKSDLVIAYTDAADRPVTATQGTLGGLTLPAGVYTAGGVTLALTGRLTLDGQNDPNAVWVFQATSDLVTASSSSVQLINGASACNVFWQVSSSATLGSASTFVGTILALTSITMNAGVTVTGRALARNGQVTMDSDTITLSTCSAPSQGTLSSGTGPIPPAQAAAPAAERNSETSPVVPATAILLVALAAILGEAARRPRSTRAGPGRGRSSVP